MVVCVVLHECLVYGPWWRPTRPGMRFVASFLDVWSNDQHEIKRTYETLLIKCCAVRLMLKITQGTVK